MDQDSIMKAVTYAIIAIFVIFVIRYLLKKETFANEHHHKHHHTHHSHHAHKNHHDAKPETPSLPNEVYGVNAGHNIYKAPLPCVNNQCQWAQIPGQLKYISNGEFDIWGTGPGSWAPIWRCEKPCTGNWVSVPGSLATVTVGKDHVFGTNDNGNIYQCPHTKEAPCTGQWSQVDVGLSQISA